MSDVLKGWEAERDTKGHDGDWQIMAEMCSGKTGAVLDTYNRHHTLTPDECRAIALLGAAAPDLLAVAHLALANSVNEETLDAARAAIAKATGTVKG